MLRKISEYSNGTVLKMSWQDGDDVIEGVIDTIYETNNGVNENEDGYQEYYACTVVIKKIIHNLTNRALSVNQLIEIAKIDEPTSIELENGRSIWKRPME